MRYIGKRLFENHISQGVYTLTNGTSRFPDRYNLMELHELFNLVGMEPRSDSCEYKIVFPEEFFL